MASAYRIPVAVLLRDMPATTSVDFFAPFDEGHLFEPKGPAESDIAPDAEVHVQLRLESYPGGIRATGEVTIPWFGVCRRCSARVERSETCAIDERFVDPKGLVDEDSYPIAQDFIDLEPLIHDAGFLELPLAPLCREDCQGLCAYCGIDKNEASCTCQAPVDPRWATLENLTFDE